MANVNVKDYKVTNLEGNKFQVQEQLTNGRFGKSVKITMPAELIEGKSFADTIELVKMYVGEGRTMQRDLVGMQKANGDDVNIPDIFDEDDVRDDFNKWILTARLKRYVPYILSGLIIIACVFLAALLSPTNASDPAPETIEVEQVSKYELIQNQITAIEGKRIGELEYMEDIRGIKAAALENHKTKIASYNDDINAAKDRMGWLDNEIASLKKQQVLQAAIVSD